MASIVFTGKDVISAKLSKTLQMTMLQVANEVEKAAKSKTPVKTGYTRRQWTKQISKTDFEVANRVAWIERLEAGASKQAPRGIIGPTLTALKGKIK
jgi:HK97 gp10 family phage protein